ncbi:GAF and ANTAR domain-containing protein [Mycolicibacterium madagascariense]|uniref:GAF and ANTAR domain-containing protein n=1 Tax=Mycolicibacterium madagascariense TaxID=212765 RepID=UPI0013D5D699|nr:GAF and ANTAR domain-containing protein [Mycolicibacterium madagascariense]MCV7011839.1 GAF and ANTAR domain-containing protein [Mycolicibacterium madagascariense]
MITRLASGRAIADVLANLTAASVELVQGADCAKISVIANGVLCSTAATSEIAASLDAAQQLAQRGPCLEAISTRRVIRCDDLRTDLRWPQFAPRARTAGVHSVMSCPIDTPGTDGATLSLFGFRAGAFGSESEAVGAVLASHASMMFLNQRQERQFKAALATRDVIGQAKGMIMERFGVDADDAFSMLKTLSQEMNSPVRVLAARFVNSARRGQDSTARPPR